ncbi:MAG: hypothetical protein IPG75_18180 [Gemmatimonadetes bacterium]|nr:hypothetical protein [Gemmatimonadota bacterium]MBP9201382.1 hypothetical protein [Gemmatimonadales bacterium]
MPAVLLQGPSGTQQSYPSREEFALAVLRGEVREQWLIYHATTRQWLPVSAHPAFHVRPANWAPRVAVTERSPDLVLIHPDGSVEVRPSGEFAAPDLDRAREHFPAEAARPARPRPSNPVIETALRTVPTFSRALLGVATLVHQR